MIWEESLPTREMIDEKDTRGVEHAEIALNLGLEINCLEEIHDWLVARLNFSNIKLEEFISKFPI